MDIEQVTFDENKTPVKGSVQKEQANASHIVIIDDSPTNEAQNPNTMEKSKESHSTFMDDNFYSCQQPNLNDQKQQDANIFVKEEDIYIKDFKRHIDNIKIFTANSEKENMMNQNQIETNKQIANKNTAREFHLLDTIAQQKQNELNIFKDSQNEEFKIKLKQKDLILSQKDDENRELIAKIKMLEQKLSSQEVDFIQVKQMNREYQQQLDNQKSVFENKINQDYTSEINSQWKTQLYEQKSLVEELHRKVAFLENKLQRIESESQSIAEKNMELNNENFDLKEEIEKKKREFQLLKAEKRQEDSIFDEYGNQQNKFISSLKTYQKDLKDVFDQINNNPIIEKYKKQNDELLIENTSLRESVIKLNQEMSDRHLEDIKRSKQDNDKLDDIEHLNSKSNALMLYENMMQKFTEMDERMVQNDNEKFEALQQKDFWFNKCQQIEQEVSELKEEVKQLSAKNDDYENQMQQNPKYTNKKAVNPNLNRTKKRKVGKDASDIEDEATNNTDKKIKPNLDISESSPQKSLYDGKLNHSVSTHNANNNNHFTSSTQSEHLNVPSIAKTTSLTTPAPAVPVKNTSLFLLKVCIKCNLNIKKMQEYETCQTCRKDYHSKCKGESIVGAFCNSCHEKQKKKANTEMEVEKPKEDNMKPQDMIAEN